MKVKFLGTLIRKEEFQALMKDVEAFSTYLNQCSEEDFLEFYSKAQFIQLKKISLTQHDLLISQHLEKQSSSFLNKVLEVLHDSYQVKIFGKNIPIFNFNTALGTSNPSTNDFVSSIEEHITTIIKYRNLQDKLVNISTQDSDKKAHKI